MLSFENDYNVGAHPRILERLSQTNLEPQPGYCEDRFCQSAKQKIRAACQCPNADVFFLVGGTQTNSTVIDALLRSYEGVVAASSGHIATHEAGAVEFTGHKVIELPAHDGKLRAADLGGLLRAFEADSAKMHLVHPGMVYLSYPTELGTLYSKAELTALYALCRSCRIPLFIDGARLGYGLVSAEADLTLPELAALCDVFYIGGTKLGALCGEAVVFPQGNAPKNFLTVVKRHGALLAKGRLLGIQFDTLFEDGLYFELSRNAIKTADALKSVLHRRNCKLWKETPTNQQFVILENSEVERLRRDVAFSDWARPDDRHTVVRFVTCWATSMEDVRRLSALL